ncbi:MAG: hypothetical protein FD150_1524 [Rhodobacteraceae bacterium]|nr:MAG: hypothetical protein FD150_1524 [Paracoccaceae bacterium]
MIRLFGSFIMLAITASGYMYFDYRMSAKWAGREDAEGLTFTEYLSGLSGRIAGLASASAASGLPTKLADMLPKPPEGWTARPVSAADIEPFLPKSAANADKKAMAAIEAMVLADGGTGTEVATLAYERGDRTVLIRAVRYPNIIFTSFMAMEQRITLQMQSAEFRGTEFMTVRGLDVTEDLLPEGFRGRYFVADVGAQIHLRVLAPKRMKDEDLVPFFETLHVQAMNASVIDKVEGLGEVPVIVLASAMDTAERDAYLAAVAAREAEAATREAAKRLEAEAEATKAPAEATGGGFLSGLFGGSDDTGVKTETPDVSAGKIGCETGKDGVKRCKVDTGAAPEASEAQP